MDGERQMTALPPLNKMQERAIEFALERPGCAWFMPPGMGKTRGYCELINETSGRTLVIAPKLVCTNVWPREIKKWGYGFTHRFLHGTRKTLAGRLPDVSLINYEAIPWLVEKLKDFKRNPFNFVVYDELSKMKNPESKRCEAWAPIIPRFKYRLGGTGTPVGAHLKDLFGEMLAVDNGRSLGTNFERFLGTYFDKNEYTQKLEPYSDTEDQLMDKIADRAISFDINDLDMPAISYTPIYLDMPPAVREVYEEMHELSSVDELDITAVNAAVKSGKLRQIAAGGVINDHKARTYLHTAKSEALKDIVDELQGEPVMIFFEFVSDYVSICNTFKRHIPALYGKTSAKEANKIIANWNAGRLPVVALHPRSAAYGVNMQESGRVVVWYTLPWSYELINQGIARVWRQGQRNKVLVYSLIVGDTIDEDVYERVSEREATHNRVMEALL
jgi:SNF2 family DNA or RNA helicase